jgi:antitoxin HicB
MEYFAKFEPDLDGGFVIEFPDFGWGVSQGDDEEDGRRMATDLLTTMVQEHIRNGKELPKPGRFRGPRYRLIRLPASQGMKAELYLAWRSSGLTKAQLARRIGITKVEVGHLLDLSRRARVEQLEAAFAALGKQITIGIRDAA